MGLVCMNFDVERQTAPDGAQSIMEAHKPDLPAADAVASLCTATFSKLPPKGKPPTNKPSWTVLAGVVLWDRDAGTLPANSRRM